MRKGSLKRLLFFFIINEYEEAGPQLMPWPSLNGVFETQKELFNALNSITKLYLYICCIEYSKGPKYANQKLCIRCTSSLKPRLSKAENTWPGATSQRISCSLLPITSRKLKIELPKWQLQEVRNLEHNHRGSSEVAHPYDAAHTRNRL